MWQDVKIKFQQGSVLESMSQTFSCVHSSLKMVTIWDPAWRKPLKERGESPHRIRPEKDKALKNHRKEAGSSQGKQCQVQEGPPQGWPCGGCRDRHFLCPVKTIWRQEQRGEGTWVPGCTPTGAGDAPWSKATARKSHFPCLLQEGSHNSRC